MNRDDRIRAGALEGALRYNDSLRNIGVAMQPDAILEVALKFEAYMRGGKVPQDEGKA